MVFQEGVCFLEYHILFVTIYGPGAVNSNFDTGRQ